MVKCRFANSALCPLNSSSCKKWISPPVLRSICDNFITNYQLFAPWRMQDAITEIFPVEVGNHKCTYISFNIAKSSFGFVLKAAEESWYDIFLEIIPWKSPDNFFP